MAIQDLDVAVSVVLAQSRFPLEELLELKPGRVLDFATRHDEPLTLYLGNSLMGKGRAVDLGEHLGVAVEDLSASSSAGPKS